MAEEEFNQWSQEEWENTILNFANLQGEINYKQAQKSLQNLLDNLDLKKEEKIGLETDIGQLTAMLEKTRKLCDSNCRLWHGRQGKI